MPAPLSISILVSAHPPPPRLPLITPSCALSARRGSRIVGDHVFLSTLCLADGEDAEMLGPRALGRRNTLIIESGLERDDK